jgi:hypothetical protein
MRPSSTAVVAVAEQAAMALRDADTSVTLLCPALVRSGMSDVGDDPADVAAAALAASRAGRFLVGGGMGRCCATARRAPAQRRRARPPRTTS